MRVGALQCGKRVANRRSGSVTNGSACRCEGLKTEGLQEIGRLLTFNIDFPEYSQRRFSCYHQRHPRLLNDFANGNALKTTCLFHPDLLRERGIAVENTATFIPH